MIEDPIERLNAIAMDTVALLDRANEVSLRSDADDIFRRAIVLAIGSYFERKITAAIEGYCSQKSSADEALVSFVRNKAIARQYHTYFNWKAANVNNFLGLFGKNFQTKVEYAIANDSDAAEGMRKFVVLSSLRNEIAHGNFAAVPIDISRDDIVRDYKLAMKFIKVIEASLEA